MRNRITITTLYVASLIVMAPLTALSAQPQAGPGTEGPVVEATGQRSRGAGDDEHIKSTSVANNPNQEATVKAPPEKGGEQTRGAFCYFAVDNRTPWKIQIFVDGMYVGLVSPWGDATGITRPGPLPFTGWRISRTHAPDSPGALRWRPVPGRTRGG